MTMRALVGTAVAFGIMMGAAFLSRVPLSLRGSDGAVLRLSWRTDPVAVEACRLRTDEELARLPVHMRTPTVCSGAARPYVLRVLVDRRERLHDTIVAAGAREDRPLYVFREIGITPGAHELEVAYAPLMRGGTGSPAQGPSLAWNGSITARTGRVVLVTLDTAGRSLQVR
jgi:hypothetical protein